MDDKGAKYYYSRLTDGEKDVYNHICEALLRFEPMLSVLRVSSGDIHKIINAVLFDNPVFFYLNRKNVRIGMSPLGLTLMFQYDYSKSEAEAIWQTAQSKIDDFMQTRIKPNMKPLARQIEAHRWMQQNIRIAQQPYTKDCFSLVGALVKGRCVCEGFAHAYKLFCDRLHLASIIVTGTGINPDGINEPHAWNITRIDGVTAHIDVTWDTIYGEGSYDYFNLTDDEIAVDHIFDRSVYPKCTENNLNYFKLNGLIAHDRDELCKIIANNRQKAVFSVKLEFECNASHLAVCGFPAGKIRYNTARNIVFFSR
ncbi:MAG: hypothetical protein ACI396_07385 [Acutalibacteraceae bacterium]